MTDFQREDRYLVIKRTDIQRYLNEVEEQGLYVLAQRIYKEREEDGRPPLKCVVVEGDWPEYEPTWNAIQKRVETEGAIEELWPETF